MSKGLNIDAAIARYNSIHAKEIASGKMEKMHRIELAVLLWPHVSRETAAQYLSAVALREDGRLTALQVRILCQATGADANFIFGVPPMKGVVI